MVPTRKDMVKALRDLADTLEDPQWATWRKDESGQYSTETTQSYPRIHYLQGKARKNLRVIDAGLDIVMPRRSCVRELIHWK